MVCQLYGGSGIGGSAPGLPSVGGGGGALVWQLADLVLKIVENNTP